MKYKIAILGSAVDESAASLEKARMLGQTLASHADHVMLLNGACPGMPDHVIRAARANTQMETWGYSSSIDQTQQQKESPVVDVNNFTKLIYVFGDFLFLGNIDVRRKYRNVILTATCDAGIVVSGRWGTLNEFTNLYDMGKVIGVLTGTGGAADELPALFGKISKPTKAKVIFHDDPHVLVEQVLQELKTRRAI